MFTASIANVNYIKLTFLRVNLDVVLWSKSISKCLNSTTFTKEGRKCVNKLCNAIINLRKFLAFDYKECFHYNHYVSRRHNLIMTNIKT